MTTLFLLLHLLGARSYTRVFSGTGLDLPSLFLGVSYAVFYLAFVAIVPLLAIAATLLFVFQLALWWHGQR